MHPWEEPTLKENFIRLFAKPLSRLRRQRLAAARSRSGSERPPDVHSHRRAASLPYRGAQPIFFLPWVDVGIDPYKLSIF